MRKEYMFNKMGFFKKDVQGHAWLYSKSEVSLGCLTPCILKRNNKRGKF